MSPFEYTTILVSIMLGLGIAQIVAGIADAVYHSVSIKHHWPHTAWVAIVLFLLVQDWIVTYQLKEMKSWDLPTILFVLAYPGLLYLLAHLLFPPEARQEPKDMQLHLQKIRWMVLTLFSATVVLSIIFNVWLLGLPWLSQWVLLFLLAVLGFFIAIRVHHEVAHRLLVLGILLGLLVSAIVEIDQWVIG